MRILVIGANGQLAQELRDADTNGICQFAGRETLDLENTDQLAEQLREFMFDLLINAAAYTAVDAAETNPETAARLNAIAPGILAQVSAERGAPIIHISTDYVFDGTNPTPYSPLDKTAPINVYGQTKLDGEHAVADHNPHHLILRTSWVYSRHGANFVKTMLRLASQRDALSIVGDQFGSPTSAANLAKALLEIAPQLTDGDAPWGVHHYTDINITNWASFASQIFEIGKEFGLIDRIPNITAIPATEYPTPAKRPQYSAMDCTSFDSHFPNLREPWQDALRKMLAKLPKDTLA